MSVSNTDLTIGFDPTGSGSITGAQLAQMVTGAAPYADKGLIVTTTDVNGTPDVPSVSTYAKLARYMWLRVSPLSSAVTAYVWNPAQTSIISYINNVGDPANIVTNWVSMSSASIGIGAIHTGNIADGAVTDDKILSVSASKITGTVTDSTVVKTTTIPASASTTPVGTGVIGGAFGTGLTLLNNAVETASIKDGAVLNVKLKDKDINIVKLLGSAVDGQIPQTDSSSVVTWQTKSIVKLLEPTTQIGMVPQVLSTGTYALGQVGFRGQAKNLVIKSTGAITAPMTGTTDIITITADSLVLQSVLGGIVVVSGVSLNVDISTGIQQNSRDFSTVTTTGAWYYVWVCKDTVAGATYGIISTSKTFPLVAAVPSTAFVALVGVICYGASGLYKIRPFVQFDNKVFQMNSVLLNALNATTVNLWQAMDATYVPSTIPDIAKTIFGFFGGDATNQNNIQIAGGLSTSHLYGICSCSGANVSNTASTWIGNIGWGSVTCTFTIGISAQFEIPMASAGQLIFVRSTTNGLNQKISIMCTGFTI